MKPEPEMELSINWACSLCGEEGDGFTSMIAAEAAFDDHVDDAHSDEEGDGD